MDAESSHAEMNFRRIRRNDGLRLAVEDWGHKDHPAVILAHGFGQSRRAWRNSARQLSELGLRVLNYDTRGHGDSDYAEPHNYKADDLIADLKAVAALCVAPPWVIGASLGGLTAMMATAEAPALPVQGLVLVDISPRWCPAGMQRIVQFMQAKPEGFKDLDEVRATAARYLPQRSGRPLSDTIRQNLRQDGSGRLRWHWDQALLLLTRQSDIHQQRVMRAAARLPAPALLLSAADSELISREHIREFIAIAPQLEHIEVPGVSHRIAGDDNDAFNAVVCEYLSRMRRANPIQGSARS